MKKLVQGKGTRNFGPVEASLSINWSSLATALILASLGFFADEVLPYLEENKLLSGSILGLLAVFLPVIRNFFRDNRDIVQEKVIK